MTMTEQLFKYKIVAIVRGIAQKDADSVIQALYNGGIRFVEVTMNTDGALQIIEKWRRDYDGKMFVGAGTVLNVELAKQAVAAGAQFIVTPNTEEAVIRYGVEHNVAMYPGAMTPSEIVRAWESGAQTIKVFPAGTLGISYIKELQGPLSHVPLMATGGVNLSNMDEYYAAGAKAFGIGGQLINKEWIAEGKFDQLEALARQFSETALQL
ncbi:bifunctional 4-hydroxy-2-oxoglutarate aldolase/2-dehydro-3-deoxy-phosphogluconate aldolase [Paenibacillus yanchengensis]|uniref:Bifunctional 4-hydroxy-2-oxoglutarate aldolase/2-dehydro-3-deoxy-phosphogluconate aldolase n=1 Tax=Paenibacillus yanchengensis TaxID=2035833 RepID=A0ABW4YQ89_9BACL